jgi:hypothetical protein
VKDDTIAKRIGKLIDEEHRLYQRHEIHERERAKLKAIEVELDQCWDLLRQRRAKREFGENADEAKARGPEIVEDFKE